MGVKFTPEGAENVENIKGNRDFTQSPITSSAISALSAVG